MEKIRIGILGYGNLGKGVELAINKNPDMELVAIFTRRDPSSLKINSNVPVVHVDNINEYVQKIDVLVLCGGSFSDLPIQGPKYAKLFNTIDSFDTHAKIPEYFNNINKEALENNHVSIISVGWDPGLFSLNRLYSESILPNGNTYTFWGKGVSQGHSDAIRKIPGVKNAIQYTIPIEDAINRVRNGENPTLSNKQKHLRECFVVLEDGVSEVDIENKIKTMPNYFDEYDTIVHFVSDEELKQNHSKMPHGGFVIRSGNTTSQNKQLVEYSLTLDSNPEFTGSVLLAYARAAYRLSIKKDYGAKTVLDIAPSLLSIKTQEEMLKNIL